MAYFAGQDGAVRQGREILLSKMQRIATSRLRPIAVIAEDLDFAAKKKGTAQLSPEGARMLSGLLYAKFRQLLEAKCFRADVELIPIDPAYTSTIGAVKYAAAVSMPASSKVVSISDNSHCHTRRPDCISRKW